MSSGVRLGKSAKTVSGVSLLARLASTVRSVTLVPLKTGSPPQILGSTNDTFIEMQSADTITHSVFPLKLPISSHLDKTAHGAPLLRFAFADLRSFALEILSRLLVPSLICMASSLCFAQRASTAFLAASLRSSGVSLRARAFPPRRPSSTAAEFFGVINAFLSRAYM